MNNFKTGWFVIYTKPRHEKKVSEQLHKADVSAFLPMIKTLKTWCDRKKYVEMPVFPSYVFVKLPDNQSYYRTLQIDGMLYYLRTGKEIATVSETVISNIKMLLLHPQHIEVCHEHFQPGLSLVVKEGPFTGFSCEVVNYKGKEKILVRIELLKRSLILNLPVDHLFQPVSCNDATYSDLKI
ncbi:MAG TPA: UpxY family transcription antiterminator [Puia sp.]